MALSIEYIKIADLSAYEKNARMHSDEQVDQIAASIQEFGFTNPVLVNEQNVLIAGHGRLEGADQLGLDEVPAIRLKGLSDRQQKALRIADNQLALNATWDLDLLAAELSDLNSDEFDMELIGFDDEFISGLLSGDDDIGGDGQEGEAPDDSASDSEDVSIVVGAYQFKVSRKQWDKWETALRAESGFDHDQLVEEVKKRLGFKEWK